MMNFNESEIIPLQVSDKNLVSRRADAAANRELILATAQRLFARQGIENVCMTAVAETAGVGKGTLYRGFANKGELCLALMDEDMRLFQSKTLQIFKDAHNQPALTRLALFLGQLAHFMDSHIPLLREAQKYNTFQNDKISKQPSSQRWLPWLRETVGGLLQQAQQNGEAADLDIPYLVDAILAPLAADLFMYQREVLGFELERISRGLRRLVLGGIKGKAGEI
jgi:AcrR family transcriptional regulator